MRCTQLVCQQFRNLAEVSLALPVGTTVLLGDNGQGKTNLLEALWLLSRGRSYRASSDRELIRWVNAASGDVSDSDPPDAIVVARIEATFEPDTEIGSAGDTTLTLSAQWWVENDRLRSRWQTNGVVLGSRSQLVGLVPTVGFFSPDLLLLRGSPSDRRNWLDGALIQYKPVWLAVVQRFQTVRKQKAELLKQLRWPLSTVQQEHLTVWNTAFAETAAELIHARLAYLQAVLPVACQQYHAIAEGQETLTLTYAETAYGELSGEVPTVEMLKTQLIHALQEKQREEVARQSCVVGPHRDDVGFALDCRDATAYASQGQQRSIVLALKLAEVAVLAQARQTQPILLLDDVMAELDPHRQAYLLGQLTGQVVLTTTHLPPEGPMTQVNPHTVWVQGGQVGVSPEATQLPKPVTA